MTQKNIIKCKEKFLDHDLYISASEHGNQVKSEQLCSSSIHKCNMQILLPLSDSAQCIRSLH